MSDSRLFPEGTTTPQAARPAGAAVETGPLDRSHGLPFPLGDDAMLRRRSNPPLYTAYPNPALRAFVEEHLLPGPPPTVGPFVGHLKQDGRHPVYTFHPYHTKVPPEAIAELIRHYSPPGGLVLDIFAGSGMTGVAARDTGRHAVLVDLSPAATFIAAANTRSHSWESAVSYLTTAIDDSELKWGHLYATEDGIPANYFVWSDVFRCPQCRMQFPFFPHGVIHTGTKVQTRPSFPCPHCKTDLNVRRVERILQDGTKQKELVWVNAGSGRHRVNRPPSGNEIENAALAEEIRPDGFYPTTPINPVGYSAKLAQLGDKGISDVSRLLSRRNLIIFSDLWERLDSIPEDDLRNICLATLTSVFTVISERQGYFGGGGGMSGNLYMPIVRMEKNVYATLRRKLRKLRDAEEVKRTARTDVLTTTQSATNLAQIPDASIDYVFCDPPFGANIIYSEVNLALEGWLGVLTNPDPEAVVDTARGRGQEEYGELMASAFAEAHRVMKPGAWITVEFHNADGEIWNVIQDGLLQAGFEIAAASTLDKGTTTILGDIRPNSAKHDVLISAYKVPVGRAGIASEAPTLSALEPLIAEILADVPRDRPKEVKHHVFSRLVAHHLQEGWRIGFSTRDLYAHLDPLLSADHTDEGPPAETPRLF